MITMLIQVLMGINLSFSNFTDAGIIRVAFDPYLSIFGNFTWGILFGFIGAGLYANERSIATTSIYLILVGIFFSIIFPLWIVYIFGLLLSFLLTTIFYVTFVKSRR